MIFLIACSNKASVMDEETAASVHVVKKHWEATSIKKTNKSEENIRGILLHKTDIEVMNVIGAGT